MELPPTSITKPPSMPLPCGQSSMRLYKLPVDYNAANRFRMGRYAHRHRRYGLYNELQVFAPELRGSGDSV